MRALEDERLAIAAPPLRRHRDAAPPAEELAGDTIRVGADLLRRALRDDMAAMLARAGANIHDPVRRPHRVFVVLDDDQRVALIAEPQQGSDQPVIVPLMQPDTRFIENVDDTHQTRTDLRCEADALCLTSGQRRRRPIKRKVIEPDIHEETEPFADLLEDLPRDNLLPLRKHQIGGRQLEFSPPLCQQRRRRKSRAAGRQSPPISEAIEEALCIAHRHLGHIAEVVSGNRHSKRFRLQSLPLADRARLRAHVPLDLRADISELVSL